MTAASQDGLDPRQLRAREEFQRMREQMGRTLERTIEPAPWRARERERKTLLKGALRRRTRPLASMGRTRPVLRAFVLAFGAFAIGVVCTLAAIAVWRSGVSPAAVFARSGGTSEATLQVEDLAPVAESERSDASELSAASALDGGPEGMAPAAAASADPVSDAAEAAASDAPDLFVDLDVPTTFNQEAVDVVLERVTRVREIQRLLGAIGYAVSAPSGEIDDKTTAAAALFAQERGLEDSNLDYALLAALYAAYEGRLPMLPDGVEGETALERVTRIREIQALLNAAGYELGRPDGDAGPKTLEAAADVAARYGLADAHLDPSFLAFLRVRPRVPAKPPVVEEQPPAPTSTAATQSVGQLRRDPSE